MDPPIPMGTNVGEAKSSPFRSDEKKKPTVLHRKACRLFKECLRVEGAALASRGAVLGHEAREEPSPSRPDWST